MARTDGIKQHLTGETRTPDEIRDAVYLTSGDVGAKQSRFWLLLVLATGIATAGVLGDSTATVIGAMIVAPLATPIQGVAVAIAYGELQPLLRSATILAAAIIVVIALAALMTLLLPELKATADNSQVSARVSPTIIDLVAAATTGLAGAFAVGRRDIGDILPGVAIAISLVPPLAVVGVVAVEGDWDGAFGAFLLFVTNVLAIIVVGVAVFSAIRVRQGQTLDPEFRSRPVYGVVAVAGVFVVGALSVATFRTVQLSNRLDAAEEVATDWAEQHDERLVEATYDGDDLNLIVEGLSDGRHDSQLVTLLRGAVPPNTTVVLNRVAGSRQGLGSVGR